MEEGGASSPKETAPIGNTLANPATADFSMMYLVTAALSLTGSVLAMHATEVTPPTTADIAPVATVSLYS